MCNVFNRPNDTIHMYMVCIRCTLFAPIDRVPLHEFEYIRSHSPTRHKFGCEFRHHNQITSRLTVQPDNLAENEKNWLVFSPRVRTQREKKRQQQKPIEVDDIICTANANISSGPCHCWCANNLIKSFDVLPLTIFNLAFSLVSLLCPKLWRQIYHRLNEINRLTWFIGFENKLNAIKWVSIQLAVPHLCQCHIDSFCVRNLI